MALYSSLCRESCGAIPINMQMSRSDVPELSVVIVIGLTLVLVLVIAGVLVFRPKGEASPETTTSNATVEVKQWLRDFTVSLTRQSGRGDKPQELPAALSWSQQLADHLRQQVDGHEWPTTFDRFLRTDILTLVGRLTTYVDCHFAVSTATLYQCVNETVKTATRIDIADQDIFRWSELVVDTDRIPGNTFNYSRSILSRCWDAAEKSSEYRLRRVFVVCINQLNSADDRDRVRRILTELEKNALRYPVHVRRRVRNCVYLKTANQNFNLNEQLRDELKDAVIAEFAEGDRLILQEDITCELREDTLKSRSKIAAAPAQYERLRAIFQEVFDHSDTIHDFLPKLDAIIMQGDRDVDSNTNDGEHK